MLFIRFSHSDSMFLGLLASSVFTCAFESKRLSWFKLKNNGWFKAIGTCLRNWIEVIFVLRNVIISKGLKIPAQLRSTNQFSFKIIESQFSTPSWHILCSVALNTFKQEVGMCIHGLRSNKHMQWVHRRVNCTNRKSVLEFLSNLTGCGNEPIFP